MKKRIAAILLVLVCACAFFACTDSSLAGTYESSFTDDFGRQKIVLVLEKNKTFRTYKLGTGETEESLEDGLNVFSGKYTAKKGKLTLNFAYFDPVSAKDITDTIVGEIHSDGKIRIELFVRSNLMTKKD